MKAFNLDWNIVTIDLNREDFCQSCEAGICIQNCKECLINLLLDYKPRQFENMELVDFADGCFYRSGETDWSPKLGSYN